MERLDDQVPDLVVSVQAFKRAVHLPEDELGDDAALTGYLLAAQDVVETATRRPLAPCRLRFVERGGPWRRWWLPVAPVTAIEMVEVAQGDAWVALDANAWRLELGHDEPQLVLAHPADRLGGAPGVVRATVQAGGPAPRRLTQAIILMVKGWHEAGIAIEPAEPPKLSFGEERLIRQNIYRRPLVTAAA
ncbi:hypothetical protein EKE94_03225 [Mesobaculum littorinae]|uniref:Phage gp6-like head-tail connector protein n=1 Tax=Mesobaculum littorinae TaxID=2486419 RepID=A0A438AM91_9RHOB|nr:hypothetical protein [Mesobaculum littorinae]RVV99707.1 hypothetical protein EKE94_03225 [Mesobaculum littorinae]